MLAFRVVSPEVLACALLCTANTIVHVSQWGLWTVLSFSTGDLYMTTDNECKHQEGGTLTSSMSNFMLLVNDRLISK